MVDLANKTVILKFWASWCGPCKTLSPTVDKVSAATNIEVLHINIEEDTETTAYFGVRSIPMLIAIKDGQPIGQMVGNGSEEKVKNLFSVLI